MCMCLPTVVRGLWRRCCAGCTSSKLFDLSTTCFTKAHSSAQHVLQMGSSAATDDVVRPGTILTT